MKIKDELNKLSESDVYSLMLFTLFKTRDVPEFSTLSELVYILDRGSLLKICEFYGGQTITIPTISQLEDLIYALILYQYLDVEHKSYDDAIKQLGCSAVELRTIKDNYDKLKEVLQQYEFSSRG